MSFRHIKGVVGKVYVPEHHGPKKHDCPDCYSCQMCPESRCRVCIKRKKGCCKNKSSSK